MVELIYPDLNLRFDMRVIFMTNYFFSVADVPVDSEMILVTDFINLNIKLTQFFRGIHKDRVCVHAFIGVSTHTCISIYIYTVFLKKKCGGCRPRWIWGLLNVNVTITKPYTVQYAGRNGQLYYITPNGYLCNNAVL
jgi:hypothetical protein